jgi:hypothetical protein
MQSPATAQSCAANVALKQFGEHIITLLPIPPSDGPKQKIMITPPRTSKRGRLNKPTEFRSSARNGPVA